jgi:hypothetical protein
MAGNVAFRSHEIASETNERGRVAARHFWPLDRAGPCASFVRRQSGFFVLAPRFAFAFLERSSRRRVLFFSSAFFGAVFGGAFFSRGRFFFGFASALLQGRPFELLLHA